MSEELKVSSIEDYRNRIGKSRTIKIPSGMVFELKRLTPMDYVRAGMSDLPNDFFALIAEVSSQKSDPDSESAKKNMALLEQFWKITIEMGIINPPCLVKFDRIKAETHLLFDELELKDKQYIIAYITGKINV